MKHSQLLRHGAAIGFLVAGLTLAACSKKEAPPPAANAAPPIGQANVDGARIEKADDEPGSWMTHGRTYSEQRFSPLTQISKDNVSTLGLAWFADLDTNRGQEATPLVVDGALYVSTAWSKVKAYDAEDGQGVVGVRSRSAGSVRRQRLLRRRQSRRRRVEGQGLRRHDRWPAHRARFEDRQQAVGCRHRRPDEAVHDHRRAARRERQGPDRQRRRRARRARLRVGLRSRQRQPVVALLYRPRRSCEGPGWPAVGRRVREGRRQDLARRVVEDGRWRHGLGFDVVRSRARPAVHRCRQRQPLEPQAA